MPHIIVMYAQKVLKGVIILTNNSCDSYTFDLLKHDLAAIKDICPSVPIFSVGKSVLGRDIYAIKLGTGPRRIFFGAAFHGMEWLTAKILVTFAAELCDGGEISLPRGTTVYLVPMVNPDGVEIAAGGKRWQANARGVDINHNFDALWDLSKKLEQSHGINSPGATRYGGEYPESEPETRAIADFTRLNRFDAVFALHSQGEVIYYDFCGYIPNGTEDYLTRFEAASRYVRDEAEGIAAYGGYKDWFIKKFKKPGFTIEVGKGENPLPMSYFAEAYGGVRPILREAVDLTYKY